MGHEQPLTSVICAFHSASISRVYGTGEHRRSDLLSRSTGRRCHGQGSVRFDYFAITYKSSGEIRSIPRPTLSSRPLNRYLIPSGPYPSRLQRGAASSSCWNLQRSHSVDCLVEFWLWTSRGRPYVIAWWTSCWKRTTCSRRSSSSTSSLKMAATPRPSASRSSSRIQLISLPIRSPASTLSEVCFSLSSLFSLGVNSNEAWVFDIFWWRCSMMHYERDVLKVLERPLH